MHGRASLTYMGMSAAAAATVATVAVDAAAGVALISAGDDLATTLTGRSMIKEDILGGNEAAYEAFKITGAAATGGVIGLGAMGEEMGVCFVAGTPVMTEDGLKPIEDIRAGDLVWAMDPDTGEKALKQVRQTFVRETDELLHLFVGDEEIVTTPEHPFFVKGKGWVKARALWIGAELLLCNGESARLIHKRTEQIKTGRSVYNFEVEQFHTYFVGISEILVHNDCHGNSLKSEKTNYGYSLRDNSTNRILKYGESLYGERRYSKGFYGSYNCHMEIMIEGSKFEIHQWQHDMILQYIETMGERPPLNKSMW